MSRRRIHPDAPKRVVILQHEVKGFDRQAIRRRGVDSQKKETKLKMFDFNKHEKEMDDQFSAVSGQINKIFYATLLANIFIALIVVGGIGFLLMKLIEKFG